MDVKVKNKDVIWSYLSILISMSSNIIVVPFIIYYLSGEMLGLWYVFVSIGAIATLSDFGFAPTFARNITYCWSGAKRIQKIGAEYFENSEPDFCLMNNILNTCRRIYMFISIGVLILMLTIGSLYIYKITKDIDGYTHYYAWIIYTLSVFLNLYYNYFDSFLRGVGNVFQAQKNRVVSKSIQIVLTITFLYFGFGIVGVALAYFIFGFIYRQLGKFYFYRYENIGEKLKKNYCPFDKKASRQLLTTMWYNAWREGLIQISIYLSEQASVIICSFYLTLKQTGSYSLSLQIANAVATLSATLYGVYQPYMQAAYLNRDMDKMKHSMAAILFTLTLLMGLGVILTLLVGLPILKYVKPGVVVSTPLLLGIFLNQFILRFRNCYSSYLSCTNRLIYMKSFVVSSFLCLILYIIFMGPFHLGVWGIVLAQVISQCIYNFWYWPYFVHKELKLGFRDTIIFGYEYLLKKK